MSDNFSDEALARRFNLTKEQFLGRALAIAAAIAVGGIALIIATA